ncbi:SCO2525 family SAM-dependent methyltransferase [Streptomyces sp. NPDC002763]|uniref:SCO2525 family SAM-dependent methyltransferase n=1 Tax=Streptomyces sp. NPDC002763 TaxID=3154427 RepID=UPI00331A0871
MQLNDEAPWDDFDPRNYIERNYHTVLDVDSQIMSIVRAHFSDHCRRLPGSPIRGIDVGAGANLYPALLMLPWCDEITLLDRAAPNVEYLRGQIDNGGHDGNWDGFWSELCRDEFYAALPDGPWNKLARVAQVAPGNLFGLVDRAEYWEIGTMFFVAESISTSHHQFRRGVECFLRSLKPGAPFAAAFMEHSKGYDVGPPGHELRFPSCDVGESEILESINAVGQVENLIPYRIGEPGEVRPGYEGMILACGVRGGGNS